MTRRSHDSRSRLWIYSASVTLGCCLTTWVSRCFNHPKGLYYVKLGMQKKILEKTGMFECNPCKTPMELRLKLSKNGEGSFLDVTYYRSVVGSLRYLFNMRPDITYVVGIVS